MDEKYSFKTGAAIIKIHLSSSLTVKSYIKLKLIFSSALTINKGIYLSVASFIFI